MQRDPRVTGRRWWIQDAFPRHVAIEVALLAPERISMRTGAGNATSSRSNSSESLTTTGSRPRKKLIQTDVSAAITVTYGAPSSPEQFVGLVEQIRRKIEGCAHTINVDSYAYRC